MSDIHIVWVFGLGIGCFCSGSLLYAFGTKCLCVFLQIVAICFLFPSVSFSLTFFFGCPVTYAFQPAFGGVRGFSLASRLFCPVPLLLLHFVALLFFVVALFATICLAAGSYDTLSHVHNSACIRSIKSNEYT